MPVNGGVAQLGEHLPCKQGVMGSNPIISTIFRYEGLSLGIEKSLKCAVMRDPRLKLVWVKGSNSEQIKRWMNQRAYE